MKGKLVILSAPSGCGKSTIIRALQERGHVRMTFSVSATNRAPRMGEADGVNYHFLTDDEFRKAIAEGRFVEYEEVYPGRFYGTLRSEIDSRLERGETVVMDLDVKGGVNVKRMYGADALSLYILPPSVDELRRRLEWRGTESAEAINERVGRAEYELTFAPDYDCRVVNDDLERAVAESEKLIMDFVNG